MKEQCLSCKFGQSFVVVCRNKIVGRHCDYQYRLCTSAEKRHGCENYCAFKEEK